MGLAFNVQKTLKLSDTKKAGTRRSSAAIKLYIYHDRRTCSISASLVDRRNTSECEIPKRIHEAGDTGRTFRLAFTT